MREHCSHARYVWNLAVEQNSWWRPGRKRAPIASERCRQLTDARAEFDWLRAGSRMVQDQALRDFDQSMTYFFRGTHRKPTWRKAGINDGFRIGGEPGRHFRIRRVSRRVGEVRILKVGWVRFRWSRAVPATTSLQVTLDRAGRWHVSFTTPLPTLVRQATGSQIGLDRGVRTALVASDGQHYRAPRIGDRAAGRYLALSRRQNRQSAKSRKRESTRTAMARISIREKDRRKDWAEKVSTGMVLKHDLIVLEKLNIQGMTRKPAPRPGDESAEAFLHNGYRAKAALSRGILTSCWGTLATRLADKAAAAPGAAVVQIDPRFTSQQCRVCGHTAAGNRESQAVFLCQSCGHEDHADRNAARNILARGLLLANGEVVPAHAPGHGVSRPQKPVRAAAGTTRSAA